MSKDNKNFAAAVFKIILEARGRIGKTRAKKLEDLTGTKVDPKTGEISGVRDPDAPKPSSTSSSAPATPSTSAPATGSTGKLDAEIVQIPSNRALVPTEPKVPTTTTSGGASKNMTPAKALGIGAGIGTAGGAGYIGYKLATADGSTDASAKTQPPVPQKPQRAPAAPAAKSAAPKAATPKERLIDTGAIYDKHGVGSNDESPGAFHRAEAEIAALKKANPTHIDPRSDVNRYSGRLLQQRADDEAAAAKKAATPKLAPAAPKTAPAPKPAPAPAAPKAETPSSIEKPPSEKELTLDPNAMKSDVKSTFSARTPEQGVGLPTDTFTKVEEPKGKKKVEEATRYLSMNPSSVNMFAEAKKLTKKQDEKLDVVDDDKIDEKDFSALRADKKKMEESKMADKDYDGDGKVESSKDEVWGSRLKAAKKAGKMEEATEPALKKSTTTDPDFAAPSANPDAPESPIKYKEEPKASPVPQKPQRSTVKEAYLNMLKRG